MINYQLQKIISFKESKIQKQRKKNFYWTLSLAPFFHLFIVFCLIEFEAEKLKVKGLLPVCPICHIISTF